VWLFTGKQDVPVSVSTVHIQELFRIGFHLTTSSGLPVSEPFAIFFMIDMKNSVENSVAIIQLVVLID
jgi:hypothetical protein